MTEATVVIKGRNELNYAVKQAERQLKGLLSQGQLIQKFFKGGAILGAAFAFERLAENAERAADKIGDKGTAKALRQLNKEIDNLKSKGLNVIGRVLGDVYIAARGSDLDKLTLQARNLRNELELLRQSRSGDTSTLGPGFFQKEKQLAELEERIALRSNSLPFGERTRAPGSRGGGSAVYARPDLIEPKAPKGPASPKEELWVLTDPTILAERAWMDLGTTIDDSMADLGDNLSRWSDESFESLTQPVIMAEPVWTAFAEQGARNIQDAFAEFLFDPFESGMRGMVAGFVDAIRQMLAQYIAFQAITGIGSALAGSDNAFLSSVGGFLKGKASGGPVMGGTPYIVGEKGPELFVPGTSGNIIPNGSMGGVTLNYSIDARGGDADRLMAMLPAMLKRTKDETVAAMIDLQRRGRFA